MVQLVQRIVQPPLRHADLRTGKIPGILPGGIPSGLVEPVIGLVQAPLTAQAQRQVVQRLAVVRVGIAPLQDLHRRAEIRLRQRVAAAAQVPQAEGVVAPHIERITPQGLLVIILRAPGRVAVLLQVQARQVELLTGADFRRFQRSLRGRRDRTIRGLRVPVQPAHLQVQPVERDLAHRDQLVEDALRAKLQFPLVQGPAVVGAQQHVRRLPRGREQAQAHLARTGRIDIEHQVPAGVLHHAQFPVREEILHERLLLVGHQPAEIRLVLRVDARHQLDVRAVLVREVAVPGPAEIAVAPGPLLLARGHVVVRHVQHAAAGIVLITTLEIVVRSGDHVRSRDLDILVIGDIHPGRVVHLVVDARRDREGAHRPLTMVEDSVDIRREDALVGIVHLDGGVRPPQEGLRHLGAVVQHAPDLQVGTARAQGEARHTLLVEHPLHLTAPHGDAAVGVLLDRAVHGHEGARAVVLRPVELDAAADPGARQAHEGRLDDLVVVDEVPLRDLVPGHLHAAAEFRQDHHLDVFVLQPDGFVCLILLLVRDGLDHGIGIHHAAAALIDTFLQENRILLRSASLIGRDDDRFSPSFDHILIAVRFRVVRGSCPWSPDRP